MGLIGKKRSGKDSLAATLIEEFGFERFAFADPLKEAVLAVNPLVCDGGTAESPRLRRLQDVVSAYGWEAAKENREVRRLLQNYGVAIREIEPDFWVRATLDRALRHANSTGPVVVTDCRFPNEAQEIRDAGGVVVRIVRPGQRSDDTHASEVALDDYVPDHVVVNSGTLGDLAKSARALVRELV